MATQTYTTYKALTYGQMAERYRFILTDTTKENEYMTYDPIHMESYPFSSSSTNPSNISNWIKPSHSTNLDLVTEDFEYKDDYVTISIPSVYAGKDNIRTFNAYLVHNGQLAKFRSNYNKLSSEDLSKLTTTVKTTNFGEGTLNLSNLYWYDGAQVTRLYTTNPNKGTSFVAIVSITDINVTSDTYINHYMKSTHTPGFSTTYNKFFTHSYQAVS